ncbi:MAG: anaerobic sulfatase maturase [Lachnospirales bacterium]
MNNLNLLIKPSSSKCNINCTYCFYNDVAKNRNVKDYGFLDINDLKYLITKAIEYTEDGDLNIAFQGGEPTLVGLKYFEEVVDFIKSTGKKNIMLSLQTNGMIIDAELAKFLHANNFLVGISLDGYSDLHNLYRKTKSGSDTFKRVMKTIELFDKYKVEYNVLSLVTAQSAKHAKKVFNFFKKNNFKYLQYIYCLDPLNEEKGNHKFSLDNEGLYEFLNETFNLWYNELVTNNYISIRYFDNLIHMAMGMYPESCTLVGNCACQCVVEGNLDVFPCDFYVIDEYKIGNVKENSISEIITSEKTKDFIESSMFVPEECKSCKYYAICKNGCRRERVNGKNVYCNAYKKFFDQNIDKIIDLSTRLKNNY